MTCDHRELHTTTNAFRVTEGPDAKPFAYTIHVTCCCASCGQPFKFLGSYVAPPPSADCLRVVSEPWANAGQTEVAMMMQPAEGPVHLAWAQPAGRA